MVASERSFSQREEGQVELVGRRLTDLAQLRVCRKFQRSVNRKWCRAPSYIPLRLELTVTPKTQSDFQHQTHGELVYRPLQFQKCSQLFIRTHNEPDSIAAMHA